VATFRVGGEDAKQLEQHFAGGVPAKTIQDLPDFKLYVRTMVTDPHGVSRPTALPGPPRAYLARHAAGDWGDLDEPDRRMNELALRHDERILSAYALTDGTRIYVITEADRSVTTILLPEEY
jgi:hypothetical protein